MPNSGQVYLIAAEGGFLSNVYPVASTTSFYSGVLGDDADGSRGVNGVSGLGNRSLLC